MAQPGPALFPLILMPPLLDQAFRMPEPTIIFKSHDDLPSFTLMLDWQCPACSEGQQHAAYERGADADEHVLNHFRARSVPFLEL